MDKSASLRKRIPGDVLASSGKRYQIRNHLTRKFLTLVGPRGCKLGKIESPECIGVAKLNARFEQWFQLRNASTQIWHEFKLSGDRFLYVSEASGLCLTMTSAAPGALLEQRELQEHDLSQMWTKTPDDVGPEFNFLKNVSTKLFLELCTSTMSDGVAICQGTQVMDQTLRSYQVWEFVELVNPNLDENFMENVSDDVFNIGDISRMVTLMAPTPSRTAICLIGQLHLPFLVINDPLFNRLQQMESCPNYTLRRQAYWQLLSHYDHGGLSEVTQRRTFKIGQLTGNDDRIMAITGMFVEADGSIGFTGRIKMLKEEIVKHLKIRPSTDSSPKKPSCKTLTVEHKYPMGTRFAEAYWCREDKYVLLSQKDTVVLEWVVRSYSDVVTDGLKYMA